MSPSLKEDDLYWLSLYALLVLDVSRLKAFPVFVPYVFQESCVG